MQFEISSSLKRVVVTFTNFNISKVAAKEKLFSNFRIIGGNNPLFELEWVFPPFVTLSLVQEIIHNTCFVCGGLMVNGVALKVSQLKVDSEWGGVFYDNPEDSKIIKVRKCSSCGHSHT